MRHFIGLLIICLLALLVVPIATFAQDEPKADTQLFFTQTQMDKIRSFTDFKDMVAYLQTVPGTKEEPLEPVSAEEAKRLKELTGGDQIQYCGVEAGYLFFGHDSGQHSSYPRTKYIVYESRPYAVNDLVSTWSQQEGWEQEYMVTHLWAHENSDGSGQGNETAWQLLAELDGDAWIVFRSHDFTPLGWDNKPASHGYYFGIHAFANSSGLFNRLERVVVDLSGGLYSYDELEYQDSWYAENVDVAIEQAMDDCSDPDPNNTWLYYDYIEIYDVNDNLFGSSQLQSYSYWQDNQAIAGIQPAYGHNFQQMNIAWLKMQAQ